MLNTQTFSGGAYEASSVCAVPQQSEPRDSAPVEGRPRAEARKHSFARPLLGGRADSLGRPDESA